MRSIKSGRPIQRVWDAVWRAASGVDPVLGEEDWEDEGWRSAYWGKWARNQAWRVWGRVRGMRRAMDMWSS